MFTADWIATNEGRKHLNYILHVQIAGIIIIIIISACDFDRRCFLCCGFSRFVGHLLCDPVVCFQCNRLFVVAWCVPQNLLNVLQTSWLRRGEICAHHSSARAPSESQTFDSMPSAKLPRAQMVM